MTDIPVIDLSRAPGERAAWDRPTWVVYLWGICELLFVTNAWQISSRLRVRVLRAFGAEIGEGVVFRPRTRVKFPWKLHIGARSWIGEGVWFHNQDHIYVGHDVVISQETFLTTGSHAYRHDMALLTRPIWIDSGAWLTSRCVVLGGSRIGASSLIAPMTVVRGEVPPNTVLDSDGTNRVRFRTDTDSTPIVDVERRVLRVVTLASATGQYGGPFDTAARQTTLANQAKFSAKVLAGHLRGDAPDRSNQLLAVPVHHFFRMRGYADAFSIRMARAIFREVGKADLVHVSYARELTPLTAVLAARILRKPLILQPHGMLTSRTSKAHDIVDATIVRPLIPRKALWIALTENESASLRKWQPALQDRVHVIGNPAPILDTDSDAPSQSDDAHGVLFAARLHARKRVLDFAAAAEIAAEQNWPDQYMVLGPDEGDLRPLLAVADRCPNLDYLGATDQQGVLDRLRRSQVFVLTSEQEPWGNVLVASIALGVPCVVTRSAALSALVEESGAGTVVPDGDPAAIASAVHNLLDRKRNRAASVCALQLSAREFSNERTLSSLQRIYGLSLGELDFRGQAR